MRVSFVSAAAGTCLLALSACMGMGDGSGSAYTRDYDRLTATCTERGGILSPTGSQSGRPANDYTCKISGGSEGLTRRN